MKRSALCCVVVVSTLLVVLMSQVPCMDAANCNYLELVACAGAITSPQPPSKDCCSKVKQQKPCFCGKFLRALHPKWRAKVMAIEDSKDFPSLALDELIGNLKVHEVVMAKDSKIYKGKKERIKSIALKAKKESSDDETLTSKSDDEEFAMAVRNFKKFFRRKGKFVRNQEKKGSQFDKGMRRKERVTRNVLDAVIQVISLAIVQKHLATKIKRLSLEVLGAITRMTPKTKPTTKLISWLNRQMSKAYVVLNKHTMKVKESLNVTFDESPPPTKLSPLVDDDVVEEDAIGKSTKIYIKEMLKKFGLEDSKPTKTSMSTEIKLTKDDEADSVDCSKSRENPKNTNLEAAKRKFRYIRGTSHLGLWYQKGTEIETVVYADSNHAGDYVDRKSTSGVCTFMGCCLTSWFAKKQTTLAISTTEAEYVSAGKACQQALWMKQALIGYGIRLDNAIGFEPFLTLNEPICPRSVVELDHSLEVKRNELDIPYIEFKLGQFTFTLTPYRLSQILKNPHALETFYTSAWSLNSLDDHPNSDYFGPKHDIVKKMIIYRMEEVIKKRKGPMPFSMLLTRLYNHILATNPQAIVPIARFTFYEHVMDPLDISRNPSTEKGKKIASPSVISSLFSSSDDNEAPSFLEFYDKLSDSEDLTKAQREKRGMFNA
nr:uncharacterized mitochondrial protein AtMg00810-like [Tanacetum cinerariifolium]